MTVVVTQSGVVLSSAVVTPSRAVRVIDPDSVPEEPISVDTLKALARSDRIDEDEIYAGFISAARARVERDIDFKIADQTFDLLYATVGTGYSIPLAPMQDIVAVAVSANGVETPVTAGGWTLTVDVSGSSVLSPMAGVTWPVGDAVRVRVHVGVADPATLDPLIVHAVGLLAVHFATAGRDIVGLGRTEEGYEVPETYREAIEPLRRITVI